MSFKKTKIGEHELYYGDCLEVMQSFEDESIDLIVTDPPYGMDYQSNRRVVMNKFDKIENDDNLEFLIPFANQSFSLLKDDTAIYLFCSWHNVDKFKNSLEESTFNLKNLLVWIKNNHGSGDLKGSYSPKHELIWFGHKGRALNQGKRFEDVIFCDKITSKDLLHPTEKPIEILELFVLNNSQENGVVLDPFMGSGSTGEVAIKLGRRFIGIEKDLKYFKVAYRRLKEVYENSLLQSVVFAGA